MKKVYLSIAVLSALSLNTMAQEQAVAKQNISLFKGNMKDRASMAAPHAAAKDAGDIIWMNNFNTQGKWVATSVTATQGAEFGWQFSPVASGAGSIGTWSFVNGRITSASGGGYAVVKNGNPNPPSPTHVANAQFIMAFDSVFNLSAFSNVDFKFQQYGALFTDKQAVEATIDNGATWVELGNNDDMGMLTAGGGSAYANPTNRSYSVTAAFPAGTDFSSVKFRFRVYWPGANSGIMYGWFVDDVKLVEGQDHDLNLYQAFNTVGTEGLQYTKFPVDQITASTTVSFGAIVKNAGGVSQDATLAVTNTAGPIGTSTPTTIAAFGNDSLVVAGPYAIPTTTGVYNFNYGVTSNNPLENTGDDTKTVPFEVTSKVMATDAFDGTTQSITGSFFGWQNGTGDAEIGTHFEIFKDGSIGALQIGIAGVNTSDEATYIGRTIVGKIYEISAGATAPIQIDATEAHEMVGGEFGKILKVYFQAPVQLTAGKLYVVTASTFEGSPVPVAFSGFNPDGATVGFNGGAFTGLIANDVYGNVVEAPVVRLDFNDYTGLKEELANQFSVNAYPNPFNASTEISFELKNESSVSVVVSDIAGRKVMDLGANNYTAGAHKVAINAADLNAGVYNCTITIGNNVITKRIVKK